MDWFEITAKGKFSRVASTITSQSDSYRKAGRQSNADVPLVPRDDRTIAARADDYGCDQSGFAGNLFTPHTRLSRAKNRGLRVARCVGVRDKNVALYDNGKDLARKTVPA